MKTSFLALTAVAFAAMVASTLSSCSAAEEAVNNAIANAARTEYCDGESYNPAKYKCENNKIVAKGEREAPGGTVVDAEGQCEINGKSAFCQWPEGCYVMNEIFVGDPCKNIIETCRKYAQIFTGVNGSKLTESNGFGDNIKCASNGGTAVPTKANDANEVGRCYEGDQIAFCQWPTGCNDINNFYYDEDYDNRGPCSTQINNCKSWGQLFVGIELGKINESNNWGAGQDCNALGGKAVNGNNVTPSSNSNTNPSSSSGNTTGKKYCMWQNNPDLCYEIGVQWSEEGSRTEAECKNSFGSVVTSCVAQNVEYCDWGIFDEDTNSGGCWPLDPDNAQSKRDCGNKIVTECPRGVGK